MRKDASDNKLPGTVLPVTLGIWPGLGPGAALITCVRADTRRIIPRTKGQPAGSPLLLPFAWKRPAGYLTTEGEVVLVGDLPFHPPLAQIRDERVEPDKNGRAQEGRQPRDGPVSRGWPPIDEQADHSDEAG